MSNQQNLLLAKEAIKKKLTGRELNYREMYALMDEIASERLGDVLTTYFAAAGFREGFSDEELYYLTKAMVETGTQLHFDGIVADKHSIGGISGTRASMIIVPIVVAAGYQMPKTSSRAITSPAGTADVMEVLAPVNLTPDHVRKVMSEVRGCIIWGGHLGIAPADDVIIRVEEPLSFESFDKIIISIMAKKIAVSANHLVIDIPIGKTMKIKYHKDALVVKKKFEQIAHRFGIHIEVDIHETEEPAGHAVGPTLEAIDVLKVLGQDPTRPMELEARSIRLASKLLALCYKTEGKTNDPVADANEILKSGKAEETFRKIIKAQGGNPNIRWQDLPKGSHIHEVVANQSGTIGSINNYNLNALTKILGAPKDQKAGIEILKRPGEVVTKDDPLMKWYASSAKHLQEAVETLDGFPIYHITP